MNKLRTCWSAFCRWSKLFPCPGCHGHGDGQGRNAFCPECQQRLNLLTPRLRCRGCGAETDGVLAICSACLQEPPRPWLDALTLFEYQGFGKEIIRDLKFHGRAELARPLGELGAAAIRRTGWQLDLIVPIPLHFLRLWSRGYNQAGVIAQVLSSQLQLPTINALQRRHYGKKQATLKQAARHHNPQQLFQVNPTVDLKGRRVLLVDDIFTTGATLTAAAEQLLQAGCREVRVFTLARTHHYRKN